MKIKERIFEKMLIIEKGINNCLNPKKDNWSLNCFKVLDFVATRVRDCFDKSIENKQISSSLPFLTKPELIEYLDLDYPINDEVKIIREIYHKAIIISIKDFGHFNSTKKMTTKDLKKVAELISTNNYSLDLSYRIRTQPDKNKPKFNFQYRHIISKPTHLCKMELVGGKTSTDGRVCGASYKFTFNSTLGGMFLHNIWSGEFTTIPNYLINSFYSLNTYPSYLFRKYLLHLNHNIQVELDSKTIVQDLGLTKNHSTFLNNQITKYIKKLQKNKLIVCTQIKPSYGNNIFFKLRRCKNSELKEVKQNYQINEEKKVLNNFCLSDLDFCL